MQVTFSILVAVTLMLIAVLIALIFYSLDLKKDCRTLFESNRRLLKDGDLLREDLSKFMEDAVYWEDEYLKLKRRHNETVQKAQPMVIEASYKIDRIRECISIPKKIADNIETMDDKDLVNLENSMEQYVKNAVVSDLLYYCNYAVSYEVFNDSYTFLIDIPVARKTDSESAYMMAERFYPMVDIFKEHAKKTMVDGIGGTDIDGRKKDVL